MTEFANGGIVEGYDPTKDEIPPYIQPCRYPLDTWNWFDSTTIEIPASNVNQELIETLMGEVPHRDPEYVDLGNGAAIDGVTAGPVRIDLASKDGKRETTIVLYKVQFQPFKFNYWNKWYKKLAKAVLGKRIAWWLFYRNAIKINYSGKALASGKPVEPIGRLVDGRRPDTEDVS